jgi:putative CocE/NonD family hydrolase
MINKLRINDLEKEQVQTNGKSVNVELIWGEKIPMGDGVNLNATIYKPMGTEPKPVIFTLTPYIADTYHPRAFYFAQHGYAFALVDCRGRGNSGGDFEPFANESSDGHDIVDWLAAQSWCDGSVTMWGGSYGGYDQWMTLKKCPLHLKTIVPVASAHAGVDFPFFKNVFFSYEIQWLTLTSGVSGNSSLFEEESFWIGKFREMYLNHAAFKDLDQIVGNLTTHFQIWIQHPTPDEYWDMMSLNQEDYDHIDLPILTITGHYDGDQPGALHYYQAHMASASPSRDQHYLVIGPWDHAGTRTPSQKFGGLGLGEACMLDMNNLHKEWYDWTMKDASQPDFLKKRVAYYVIGAEEWKYADTLESISNKNLRLYLQSEHGQANDVFHSGALNEKAPIESLPDHYVYDPLDTRPEELEREEIKDYITDQRYALNLYGNGLVYHSFPFDEDAEVSGFVKLILWIAMDVADTDFWVTVSEITPEGKCIRLTEDILRARYRESLIQEKLVVPEEINRYEFTGFTFISKLVRKGSRLRLLVRCPNSIFIQKNYNSGGIVAEETDKVAQTAHIILYHDADYPSYLDLPVVK